MEFHMRTILFYYLSPPAILCGSTSGSSLAARFRRRLLPKMGKPGMRKGVKPMGFWLSVIPIASKLIVNGVESVKLASIPWGGYLISGMASVGVSTNCVPGGQTSLFSCVIQINLLFLWCLEKWWWEISSFSDQQTFEPHKIMAKIWSHNFILCFKFFCNWIIKMCFHLVSNYLESHLITFCKILYCLSISMGVQMKKIAWESLITHLSYFAKSVSESCQGYTLPIVSKNSSTFLINFQGILLICLNKLL